MTVRCCQCGLELSPWLRSESPLCAACGKTDGAKYVIGGEGFRRLEDVRARAQAVLAKGPHRLEPRDSEFVRGLLENSPRADKYVGVERLFVERIPQPSPHFGFVGWSRAGGRVHVAYNECIGKHSPLTRLKAALRIEVADQIAAFRSEAFAAGPVLCPVSGDVMPPAEIDHIEPDTFDALVAEFLLARGLDAASVVVVGRSDGAAVRRLEDRELASEWKDFHRERAKLRALSPAGHKRVHARRASRDAA